METLSIEQQFINAINAQAGEGDRLSEYVYADWLEDQGDPRAEGWRVLLEAGKRPAKDLIFPGSTEMFSGWHWFPFYPQHRIHRYRMEVRLPNEFYETIDILGVNNAESYFHAMDAAVIAWVEHRPKLTPM